MPDTQVLDALSAYQSSIVISRLSGLYHDMHEMLTPVLPPSNPVMLTLSSPLSPTSSPLRSSRNHLQDVLYELRKYCAATRDVEINTILNNLSSYVASPDAKQYIQLPSLILQTIRSIFTLVEEMTSDLHNFTLNNLT